MHKASVQIFMFIAKTLTSTYDVNVKKVMALFGNHMTMLEEPVPQHHPF